jgi:predicted nuclease with TOPRIM domain
MTEEIRYIANLQRQEEFDNEVTELKDELKRLEQENKELKEEIKKYSAINEQDTKDYAILRNALEEIKQMILNHYDARISPANCLLDISSKINKTLYN